MRRLALFGLVLALGSASLACKKSGGEEVSHPLGSSGGGADKAAQARFADEAPSTAVGTGYGVEERADPRATSRRAPSPDAAGAPAEWAWDDGDFERDAIATEHRPGLGTAYGEQRSSRIETVSFRRADTVPDVVFGIHYDDATGVREAARMHRTRAWSDEARLSEGHLTFALLDDGGHVLPAASVGSLLYAVGQPGERYAIGVANDSSTSYEVVLSVDGLDVIDGQPAGFDKHGYVIDPFTSVVIEGWRTSEDAVAAFRFSTIEDSYADRTGESRNIGVIGAAFFREAPREWDEWRGFDDTHRRETADPFPGNRR